MSLIKRPWLCAALLAFALRGGVAVVTEYKQIFAIYNLTDARLLERWGWEAAPGFDGGRPLRHANSPSQRYMIAFAATVYRTGHHPLLLKLICCLIAASAAAALWFLAEPLFGAIPATLAAGALAVYPSSVLYGSQFLKDGLILAPVYAALALALRPAASPRLLLLSLAALLAAGALRTYLFIPAAAALAAAAAALWLKGSRARAAGLLALALAAPAAYKLGSEPLLDAIAPLPEGTSDMDPTIRSGIVPTAYNQFTNDHYTPYSPQGLTRFRNYRQESDQKWSIQYSGRRIETQIFPDAKFESWLDVILFMPKSAFHALFMPLPGLFPMDDKLTRWFAALENCVLLAFFALALSGLVRGPITPERLALAAFVGVMIAGSSLLEFDLGAASRHKMLYLPLVFPFAAEEFLRLRRRTETAHA